MRLAFLSTVGVLGGAEWILLDLLTECRRLRPTWQLHLVAGGEGPLLEAASELGVEIHRLPVPSSVASLGDSSLGLGQAGRALRTLAMSRKAGLAMVELPLFLRRMSRLMAEIRPDLVHSNGIKCHLIARHIRPRGTPVVWHIHDFLSSRVLVGKALRRLTRRPELAVAVSQAVAKDVAVALPGVNIETVYNGIDIETFTPEGEAFASLDSLAGLANSGPDTIRVGLVATYARWKGQDVVIEAAAKLAARKDLPRIRWFIVGGPVYQTAGSQFSKSELQTWIAERGLTNVVGLIPFQRNLPPVYRSLDVVVHASTKPEPFGRTIVEAMACGRAVIVANAGGAAELLTPNVDALGVPPGDSEALAEAVASLACDPPRRVALGRAARANAVSRFTRERMGEQFVACYERLLKGSS